MSEPTRLPEVARSRRVVQWISTVVVLVIGVQFGLWVTAHLAGAWPKIPRPAGVEAFLPINSMMGLRHLLSTGQVDAVHPAGLGIFCSHICPVGLVSEILGRLGTRLVGRPLRLPKWLDIPLRGLKWFLLAFFVWAIWFAMSPGSVAAFLRSPYAKLADVKMWLFFASPSRTTLIVMGVLLIASLFIRDFWCRYLCPYGALLGLLGRIAPLKVTRDPELCVACGGCTDACPARLPVHEMVRVSSVECTSCLDCVVACPEPGCLEVRAPRKLRRRLILRPVGVALLAAVLYLVVIGGFRLTGHWHSELGEKEYHHRIQEIRSPAYSHPR
jgi:NAD-dependent dihydropyrimidine dehydrogenase PreA subunit